MSRSTAISITPSIAVDESEIDERFVRSPGPGGQHVNKVSTAVQLRFDAAHSRSLPEPVRRRLIRLAGGRISNDGILTIDAHRFRSRERNREDALERLATLIRKAAHEPKPRKKTRPSAGAKKRRLESKRQRGHTKRLRNSVRGDD